MSYINMRSKADRKQLSLPHIGKKAKKNTENKIPLNKRTG